MSAPLPLPLPRIESGCSPVRCNNGSMVLDGQDVWQSAPGEHRQGGPRGVNSVSRRWTTQRVGHRVVAARCAFEPQSQRVGLSILCNAPVLCDTEASRSQQRRRRETRAEAPYAAELSLVGADSVHAATLLAVGLRRAVVLLEPPRDRSSPLDRRVRRLPVVEAAQPGRGAGRHGPARRRDATSPALTWLAVGPRRPACVGPRRRARVSPFNPTIVAVKDAGHATLTLHGRHPLAAHRRTV